MFRSVCCCYINDRERTPGFERDLSNPNDPSESQTSAATEYTDSPSQLLGPPLPILQIPSLLTTPPRTGVRTLQIHLRNQTPTRHALDSTYPKLEQLEMDFRTWPVTLDVPGFFEKHKEGLVTVQLKFPSAKELVLNTDRAERVRGIIAAIFQGLAVLPKLANVTISTVRNHPALDEAIPKLLVRNLSACPHLRSLKLSCAVFNHVEFHGAPHLEVLELEEERELFVTDVCAPLDLSSLPRLVKLAVRTNRVVILSTRNRWLRKLQLSHVQSVLGDISSVVVLNLEHREAAIVAELLSLTRTSLREFGLISYGNRNSLTSHMAIDATRLAVLFLRSVNIDRLITDHTKPLDTLFLQDSKILGSFQTGIHARQVFIMNKPETIVSTLELLDPRLVQSIAFQQADNHSNNSWPPGLERKLSDLVENFKETLRLFACTDRLTDRFDPPQLPHLKSLLCHHEESRASTTLQRFEGKVPVLDLLGLNMTFRDRLDDPMFAAMARSRAVYSSSSHLWYQKLQPEPSLVSVLSWKSAYIFGWLHLLRPEERHRLSGNIAPPSILDRHAYLIMNDSPVETRD